MSLQIQISCSEVWKLVNPIMLFLQKASNRRFLHPFLITTSQKGYKWKRCMREWIKWLWGSQVCLMIHLWHLVATTAPYKAIRIWLLIMRCFFSFFKKCTFACYTLIHKDFIFKRPFLRWPAHIILFLFLLLALSCIYLQASSHLDWLHLRKYSLILWSVHFRREKACTSLCAL